MSKQKVIGISFGPEASVPTIVLKAAGDAAASVLERAQAEAIVPVVQAPALTERVYRTPLDAPIDKELFPVMAALLAHVMKADRLRREESE